MSQKTALSLVSNDSSPSNLFNPKIPEGSYRLAYEYSETAKMYNHGKLVLHFKVIDFGEAFSTPLQRFYNVDYISGKPKKSGSFKATKGGDFLLEYLTLFPIATPKRLDRINMEIFKGQIIIGKVKTVKNNNRQRQLPEQMQYSVIERLVRASNE
jgi:hypothetical protein